MEGLQVINRWVQRMNKLFGSESDRDLWFWVVQEDGDVVSIPVGYAHTVINLKKCVKLAMDILPKGKLHCCLLSYFHVWRQISEKRTLVTKGYLPVLTAACTHFKVEPCLKNKK